MDVDVGFDEFLGYRHCQRFFGVRVRICIKLYIVINLRRHYDKLDGESYKLGRRHDHRPVRQLYRYDFLPLLVRHLLLAQLSRGR